METYIRQICDQICIFTKWFLVCSSADHKGAVSPHTHAVFAVPVQLVPGWAGTLVAPQRVDASVLAASTIYAAFVNI